ncbi:MAG TPA: hypothetical protein VES64_01875, partial [Allosphingosinicella sp.]|nr:hypothetical protein [Allosphingosinicella sp.]
MVAMSLGTGIDSRRRRRSDDPPAPARPVAPALIAAPRLTGAGRIGGEVTLDPGRWSGVPAPTWSLQWQRNRADIPGAVAPSFALSPEADRAQLRCRVTARNVRGEAVVYSEEITIAYEAPAAKGSLTDAVYIHNSGDQILNAFPEFTGGALTFSVTGEGVAIDPVTGLLTIRTDALASGIAVVVTATNSGGTATSSFRVTVAAAAEPEVTEPVMTEAPALVGGGVIGAPVTLDPGVWSGKPAPALAFQWRRDGVDIPGATAAAYTPGAADDRTALTCAVTASNAGGSSVAVTAPRGVTYAAPTAGAGVPDQTLTQATGVKTIDAGAIFTGSGLSWSIPSGPTGVTIDKGLISIATDTLRAGVSVTLRASNSGGSVDDTFRLTVVEAAPVASGVALPDQSFVKGSGAKSFGVAAGFTGTNIVYSIVTPVTGVSIDASTGVVSVSIAALLSPTTLTVR